MPTEYLTHTPKEAYLDALGITRWVLRSSEKQEASTSCDTNKLNDDRLPNSLPNTESPASSASPAEQHSSSVYNPGFLIFSKDTHHNHLPLASHPSILLLCLHQPEYSIHSYLKNGYPSKLLAGFKQCITYLYSQQSALSTSKKSTLTAQAIPPPLITTAQLTQTSLNKEAYHANDYFTQNKPSLLFLFGEKTANHLTQTQQSLPEWQGKLWHYCETIPFVVYPHPFELQQNPKLKKQVLQDLLRMQQSLVL